MASLFPSLPVRPTTASSESSHETTESIHNFEPIRGPQVVDDEENRRPSNPFADPEIRSPYNPASRRCLSKSLLNILYPPSPREPTIESGEETPPTPTPLICEMPRPSFWKWPQGDAHPLRLVHYTLIFQAITGFVIFVLVLHASRDLGWWTQRETAVGLARKSVKHSITGE